MIRTILFTSLAAAAVADFAGHSVQAHGLDLDVGRVTVSYADLDLGAPKGAKVMATRIHNAARDICGGDERAYADLTQRRLARACIQDTSARAASKLGAPLVTAMVAGAPTVVMAAR